MKIPSNIQLQCSTKEFIKNPIIISGVENSGATAMVKQFQPLLSTNYNPHILLGEYEKHMSQEAFIKALKIVVVRDPIALTKAHKGDTKYAELQYEAFLKNKVKYEAAGVMFVPHNYLRVALFDFKLKYALTADVNRIHKVLVTKEDREKFKHPNKNKMCSIYNAICDAYEKDNRNLVDMYLSTFAITM